MMVQSLDGKGMGWLPDYPSFRDYTPQTSKVASLFKKVDLDETLKTKVLKVSLPSKKDLRKWCSPIEDQESIGSCTANAAVGLVEYFERRAHGKHIDASRLFLYKVTRKMLNFKGDTGAFLRTAMGALTLFGVPPEEYWPYDTKNYEKEPPAFCYSFAKNYQAINYVRLDPSGIAKDILLQSIKDNIAKGFPCMFGFTVYNSIQQSPSTGMIPYPCEGEKIDGGHAVMAVGYDDKMPIKNEMCDQATKGALIIRNSWGTEWGQCLAGNTKISLLDGREVSIEDLVLQNSPVWVYSYDTKEDRIVPALAVPKYSGYRDDLVSVTLDNGENIVCTSDHLWLKRDGSYRAAIDLGEGDSLMPLYRTTHHGYEKFYSNKHKNIWITTHWMVIHDLEKHLVSKLHTDTCKQDRCKIIIHHKDFNPKNNAPGNLEPMFSCQHISLHRAIQDRGHESRLCRWRDNYENLVKISIRNIQEYNKKLATNELKLTEKQILARRMNMLRNGMQNQAPEIRSLNATKSVKTRKEKYGSDIYSKLGRMSVKNGAKISETLEKRYANGELPITAKQLEARKRNMAKLHIKLYNHKIAKITTINTPLPVYDLIVARKNCHNFALTAGVFVHNSGYGFLPYKYVIDGLAEDWWTLIQQGWVDTGQFGE